MPYNSYNEELVKEARMSESPQLITNQLKRLL